MPRRKFRFLIRKFLHWEESRKEFLTIQEETEGDWRTLGTSPQSAHRDKFVARWLALHLLAKEQASRHPGEELWEIELNDFSEDRRWVTQYSDNLRVIPGSEDYLHQKYPKPLHLKSDGKKSLAAWWHNHQTDIHSLEFYYHGGDGRTGPTLLNSEERKELLGQIHGRFCNRKQDAAGKEPARPHQDVKRLHDVHRDPVPSFIGRKKELRRIRDLAKEITLDHAPFLVIEGPGGVGKTELASRAADELKALSQRGKTLVRCYYNLSRSTVAEGGDPEREVHEHMRRILARLNVMEIPDGTLPGVSETGGTAPFGALAEAYQDALASYGEGGRKVFLTLDNITDPEIAERLLPQRNAMALLLSREKISGPLQDRMPHRRFVCIELTGWDAGEVTEYLKKRKIRTPDASAVFEACRARNEQADDDRMTVAPLAANLFLAYHQKKNATPKTGRVHGSASKVIDTLLKKTWDDCLDAGSRRTLLSLSVFPGAFDELGVCGVAGYGHAALLSELLQLLHGLGLVACENKFDDWDRRHSDRNYFFLPDDVRDFAKERLASDAGEKAALHRRYCIHYCARLGYAGEVLNAGGDERAKKAMNLFKADWRNYAKARLDAQKYFAEELMEKRALAVLFPAIGARLCDFFQENTERIQWLDDALQAAAEIDGLLVRATLMNTLCVAYRQADKLHDALIHYKQAWALTEADSSEKAKMLRACLQGNLGSIQLEHFLDAEREMNRQKMDSKIKAAMQCFEEALAIGKKIEAGPDLPLSYLLLGQDNGGCGVCRTLSGDYQGAKEYYQWRIAIAGKKDVDDIRGEASGWANRGMNLVREVDFSEAPIGSESSRQSLDAKTWIESGVRDLEEALKLQEKLENRRSIATVTGNLALAKIRLYFHTGEIAHLTKAIAGLSKSADLFRDGGDKRSARHLRTQLDATKNIRKAAASGAGRVREIAPDFRTHLLGQFNFSDMYGKVFDIRPEGPWCPASLGVAEEIDRIRNFFTK